MEDNIVIEMVRRFSQDRLAPGASAREKAGANHHNIDIGHATNLS